MRREFEFLIICIVDDDGYSLQCENYLSAIKANYL